MKFQATVSCFDANSLMYEHYIPLPDNVYQTMIAKAPDKRVKCIFNGELEHYCALYSKKNTYHYILLNKAILKKFKWKAGDKVEVDIQTQNLKYGIPICKEMEEVFYSDPEGSELFHKLTIGKQRTLIHVINKFKNPQLRIDRTIIILRHLLLRNGNLDYAILRQNFKVDL